VLWAETLLRHVNAQSTVLNWSAEPIGFGEFADHARDSFAECAERGTPLTAAALAAAVQQAVRWRREIEQGTGPADTARLTRACEAVERAAEYAVAGSVFVAFASAHEHLTPTTVLAPALVFAGMGA
jgi:hypothetical protein